MKKISRILALLLVMALILPIEGGVNAESKVKVERLSGNSRINTAIAVSKKAYPAKADTVIIAGYNGQADALTGTLLAHEKKAPMLLTSKGRLDGEVLKEIKRLKASKVYILGGEAAVCSQVEKSLRAEKLDVKRLKGDNRAETAVAIADEVFEGTNPKEAFVIESNALVDALSIGSVAAAKRAPILITGKNSVLAETKKALREMDIKKATIIGGKSTVSDKGERALKDIVASVGRVYGKGRIETALAVAKEYNPNGKDLIIADGRSLPDALVGGYLSAQTGNPILLIERNRISNKVRDKILKAEKNIYILGGESVVSSGVEMEISNILSGFRNADIEPNNTFKEASPMYLNEKIRGQMTKGDFDHFKIEVPKEGILEVGFLSLNGEQMNLFLYNENYENGEMAFDAYRTKGSVTRGVGPGTYYIQVTGSGTTGLSNRVNIDYELEVKYRPSEHEDEKAGSRILEAKKINRDDKVKGNIGYGDKPGTYNKRDYFKVEIPKEGTLSLGIESIYGKNMDLYIYGEDYDKGYVNRDLSKSKTSLHNGVKAGTYYILVEAPHSSAYSPYELDVKFVPSPHDDEKAGTRFTNAKKIDVNDTIKGNMGYLGSDGRGYYRDYFKINLPRDGRLTLDLESNFKKTMQIDLHDENYENLPIASYNHDWKYRIDENLKAGDYYIRVGSIAPTGYTPYKLDLNFK